MAEEFVAILFIIVGIALAGVVSQRLFRRAAGRRSGSGVVQAVVWARSGKVPGLSRNKKWVKAKVGVDEVGRLVWVRPAGEPVAVTLRSRTSRPRGRSDLWFLDPGTPVWDAVTADGQELGLVIMQAREHWLVTKLPVAEAATTLP